MGFRDLCAFNKSLLAKNIWKLTKRPSSLLARVFKARYYPNMDILDCKVGSNASFVWRSICWSRDIFERGLRWKAGDGRSIRVFKDAWVPGFFNGKLIDLQGRDHQLKVAEMLDDVGNWDMERLTTQLLPCEINQVTEIELPKERVADTRYWTHEERGSYSVKSGYLMQMGTFDRQLSSLRTREVEWWKIFWKMTLPPKVKIFGWRIYTGLLPVSLRLRRHHIPTDGICWWCKRDWGSTVHTLLFCDVVRPFWKTTQFWEVLAKNRRNEFGDLMENLLRVTSRAFFELWLIMVWMLWKELCRAKHESKQVRWMSIQEGAPAFRDQFAAARKELRPTLPWKRRLGDANWTSPPPGSFRLDVDALFNLHSGKFGVGGIVRNERGQPLLAFSKPTGRFRSVLEAKLTAMLYGVGLCLQHNFTPVRYLF